MLSISACWSRLLAYCQHRARRNSASKTRGIIAALQVQLEQGKSYRDVRTVTATVCTVQHTHSRQPVPTTITTESTGASVRDSATIGPKRRRVDGDLLTTRRPALTRTCARCRGMWYGCTTGRAQRQLRHHNTSRRLRRSTRRRRRRRANRRVPRQRSALACSGGGRRRCWSLQRRHWLLMRPVGTANGACCMRVCRFPSRHSLHTTDTARGLDDASLCARDSCGDVRAQHVPTERQRHRQR